MIRATARNPAGADENKADEKAGGRQRVCHQQHLEEGIHGYQS
jgi:hypothetical protein